MEENGRLQLPPDYVARHDLKEGTVLVFDPTENGLALREARPDAKRAYIEVTTVCNLNCSFCIRHAWGDQQGEMSWETFMRIITQLREFPKLRRITLAGFGEPLTHPRIVDMVREATKLGVEVTLSTNGLLLNRDMAEALVDAHLSEIVISLDTAHLAAYGEAGVTGGERQVLDNVRTIQEVAHARGWMRPHIGLEFVVTRDNLGELESLPELARNLGVGFVIVSNLLPYTAEMVEQTLYDSDDPLPIPTGWPVPREGWLMWGSASLPRMKWGAHHRCDFIEEDSLVVGWDGCVSPCYALMHSYSYFIYGRRKEVTRYVLGDIGETSLSDIWTSDEYVKFRAKVREFRFPSCVDCGMACTFAEENEDCWGNVPSCADCLWARDIIKCP